MSRAANIPLILLLRARVPCARALHELVRGRSEGEGSLTLSLCFGVRSQVLHPVAMQPAMRVGMPVRVKNSYNWEAPGTLITGTQVA